MVAVWAMGMRGGQLPVQDCVRVWQALVRPVLEYGTVVWGDVEWPEAEQVQREMGKMILRCSSKMSNEVVLGELGWWTLKGRRDFLRLTYWGKIVGGQVSPNRLLYHVYQVSRCRYNYTQHNRNYTQHNRKTNQEDHQHNQHEHKEENKENKENKHDDDEEEEDNTHNTHTRREDNNNRWCKHTHMIFKSIGMEQTWLNNTLTEEEEASFRVTVRDRITAREEAQWLARMQNKPKLRTYRRLKTKLCFQHNYLTRQDREAREVMTRLRGGTNELRIETGRYAITNRERRLDESERRCLI